MEYPDPNYTRIKGWGVDADPKNDPTYPMKKYTGDDHRRLDYRRPPQQVAEVEVLHSNERPGLSAVFGTRQPPSGLSGQLRRFAFRYSENSFAHWLPLLLADRVNVAEGILNDFRNGIIPNIMREKGMGAEWKYNRKKLIKKAVITLAVSLALLSFLRKDRR
ncbi:MAG: hypothetical protein FWJ85_10125 [Solitalea sp.]